MILQMSGLAMWQAGNDYWLQEVFTATVATAVCPGGTCSVEQFTEVLCSALLWRVGSFLQRL